jgi:exosortase E/protease (VPEID-CTERM system)
MASLLPVEILLLTLSFEPSRLQTTIAWPSTLLENSSVILRIGIAMAGALVILLSPRAAGLQARFGEDPRPHPWGWLALHLACYFALFQQTKWLFGGGASGPADWHIAAWAALCLAVTASWCVAMAPAATWREFLFTERRALLASLLVGILVWVFGRLTHVFWRPLAQWTLYFAHGILRTIYPDVEYDAGAGSVGTSRLLLEIAPECSGYEGLALMTVFFAVYLWLFRHRLRFPTVFWLLPAGLLAIWIANVLRIAALVVVGTSISPQLAVQGFHSQAGWIAFAGVALGLIWVSHRAGLVTKDAKRDTDGSPALAFALLAPFMATLATSMVTAAFSHGFDALYPAGVVVTAAVLWRYRKSYRDLPFGISAVSVGIGAAVFLAWIALESSAPVNQGSEGARLPELPAAVAALWIAFRFIGSVFTVPIAEELAFRGYLLRKLVASDFEQVPPGRFTWLSFVGSTVLFGLLHQSWLAGTIAGAGFAIAVYHRGRITDAIVAHMTANALIAASVLGFGWWDLWL